MAAEASDMPALGLALVLLVHLAYAAYLLGSGHLKNDRRGLAGLYLAAVLCTAAWAGLGLLDLWSTKLVTWHLAWGFDQLRYALWYGFLLMLLRPMAGALSARGRMLGLLLPGVLLLLGLAVNISADLTEDTALLGRALAGVQMGWAVADLLLIEQLFRNQVDPSRWGVKPLCLGLGGLFAFDLYLFSQAVLLGAVDNDVLAARGLVHTISVPLLLLAARRQQGWLRTVQVSQAAAFYSATLLLIGTYLMFIAGVGYYLRYFGGSWGAALQVALGFAAAVGLGVLLLSGAARARLRVFLSKHFFSYRYDYRREWLRFTAMLATKSSPQEVGALVVRGLADMVESPAGALWFQALGDDAFVQSARWNMPERAEREAPDSPFCAFMQQREWIVELQQGQALGASDAPAPPAWLLNDPSVWLVVPLLVTDRLLGFVLLAQPRTAVGLDWEVRDLLKTAARQAAVFLAQIHAAEALLESRKFDAFNRMSAFVVHDLKNIITQLSLMMKNAERHKHNPEFQADMLLTVESSLEKMRQMLLQLREGNKPVGVVSGVELVPILQRIATLVQQRGRQVDVQVVDRLATRGQAERLERVIGHVVQNALDATPPSGRVWVTLKQASGRVMLEVGDTGAGMSQEFIQSRLFRPFNSTKTSGMGIGSFESFQYIKELGGSIDVKSDVGRGSLMTILLPLFDSRTGTDLRPTENA